MRTEIDTNKSVMMTNVWSLARKIVTSSIIKLQYMADRYETVETLSEANEYIAAYKQMDNFYSYATYSDYALIRAGLTDEMYKRDKLTIPTEKREEVLTYQRQFITITYKERNNYYRMLSGQPDLGDDYIYIDHDVADVDTTKPVHEMTDDEITRLSVLGELDALIEKYPDKLYLKHLESDYRIDIVTARTANNFYPLYIPSDRTKQPLYDMFLALYKDTREYVISKFYDEAYSYKSEYYEGYMGMFIMTITTQRYITNYFNKFINRDFYDKDIIRLLFQSYGLPFYNEIPLTYMQKVAKNLNRLLYYKATDKVFTDIFKIFDMENINVTNYLLFKDVKLDSNYNPIEIYQEKTELGYQIETVTTRLKNSDNFYGAITLDYENVNKILEISNGTDYCTVILQNNGFIFFDTDSEYFKNLLSENNCNINDNDYLQYDGYYNFTDIIEATTGDKKYITLTTKDISILYTIDENGITKIDLKELLKYDDSFYPESILYLDDSTNDNSMIILNGEATSLFYLKGKYKNFDNTNYQLVYTCNELIQSGHMYDNAISVVGKSGILYLYGDNKNNRLIDKYNLYLDEFTISNEELVATKSNRIFDNGTLYIMRNGEVRYTGSIPELGLTEKSGVGMSILLDDYYSIKSFITLNDGNTTFYVLRSYNDNIILFNYPYDSEYGSLLYEEDIINPTVKYPFIRDIACIKNSILITQYGKESSISYSGDNTDQNYPFVTTLSLITENDDIGIKFVEIYNGHMYIVTNNNQLLVYRNKKYNTIDIFDTEEYVQDLLNTGTSLIITVGKSYFYEISGTTDEDTTLIKYDIENDIVIEAFRDGKSNDLLVRTKSANLYKYYNKKFTQITNYDCYHSYDNKTIDIKFENNKVLVDYTDIENNINITNKEITGLSKCKRATISSPIIIFEGDLIYYIKIDDLINDHLPEVVSYDNINKIRSSSVRIYDNLVIYNKNGGISILRNFIHTDRLDTQIEADFTSVFNSDSESIKQITFDGTDLIKISDSSSYVTYEPVYTDMYSLKFISVPLDADNKSEYINDTANHMDYDLVVNKDKLWRADRDETTFLNDILSSEFNYVSTKYISVTSSYELTKLNFEVCYMFRQLTELKPNEKYLEVTIPYVGKATLFDTVIGLFALTAMKLGLEGRIPDTKTKILSVLGFNFSQDYEYIDNILNDVKKHMNTQDINNEDVKIVKPPALYSKPAEVINTFLDNSDIIQNVYTYKYNAKTIREYNAYKRIENATCYSTYINDIFKVNDVLPETYLDYLNKVNPNLYKFVEETDDENLVDQIDTLLVVLNDYIGSDEFKYLFLNIPSLSIDNIKKFICFLIDVFKSYTVELHSMNIIYHIDDKRLHNIKLILDEDAFQKYFTVYDYYNVKDFMDYTLGEFEYFDYIKMKMEEMLEAEMTAIDYLFLFKTYKALYDVIDTKIDRAFEDFSDFFDRMDDSFNREDKLNIYMKSIFTFLINKQEIYDYREELVNLSESYNEKDYIRFKDKINNIYNEMILDDKLYLFMYMTCKLTASLNERMELYLIDKYNLSQNQTLGSDFNRDYNDLITNSYISETSEDKIKFIETVYFMRNE